MEEIKVKKYMNPMTFEAEMFVNTLENLRKTYNNIDADLVRSLEKVMTAIETILDTSENEILATETTKLVECNIKNINRIYHCTKCKSDLGKSSEKATLHLINSCEPYSSRGQTNNEHTDKMNKRSNFNRRKEDKKSRKRIYKSIKLTKKTCALLIADYEKFYVDHVKIGEKLKCLPDYKTIEDDLLSIITPLFPNQKVKTFKFGSRLTGIGTRESDLDLFIDIGGTFNNFQNRADGETLEKLHKVGRALNKSRKTWQSLVMIDKARVPILRIIHEPTLIECDINFSNSMGTINTQFLEYIFTLQPIARFMCMFLKKWLQRTSLNEDFTTYAIIMMVVFYLQNIQVLPSMESLQHGVNTEKALYIGPWLGTFATLNLKQLNNIQFEEMASNNLLKFIKGFFKFYIDFNYEENIICPYLGKPVKRTEFDSLMPERYTNYVKKMADYALIRNTVMVVQDPIQLNHNVTKAVRLLSHQILTITMEKSLEFLE